MVTRLKSKMFSLENALSLSLVPISSLGGFESVSQIRFLFQLPPSRGKGLIGVVRVGEGSFNYSKRSLHTKSKSPSVPGLET